MLDQGSFGPRYHNKVLATKDGVIVVLAGANDDPPVINNGQISQTPSYLLNGQHNDTRSQ
jgi:hypothetical protein